MIRHENNGFCKKCQIIIDTYPDFNPELREWFEELQFDHNEAHTSCAGRGRVDQESLFERGATRAHFGESAHNYNAALDLFAIISGENTIYPVAWFNNILSPKIPDWIEWYGRRGSRFYELPHVQLKNWKQMKKDGLLLIVE